MGVPLSQEDRALFREMSTLLHGLGHSATYNFLQNDNKGKSRKDVVDKLREASKVFVEAFGCGDLCEDKNGGCIACGNVVAGGADPLPKA